MSARPPAHRPPPARLREARRQLLDTGDVTGDLVEPALRQRWQRSLQFGLVPTGRPPGAPTRRWLAGAPCSPGPDLPRAQPSTAPSAAVKVSSGFADECEPTMMFNTPPSAFRNPSAHAISA